ncbi:MAG: amidohydrolase family protein, partial [Clostridia bacterium]|nr:amidohydrolase family protein [Clostridia bacterium]
LICDGIHISPEMIRLAYRIKGPQGISLVSDSIEAAGCAEGIYNIAGAPATVKDGIARTPDGVLAGSTLSLDRAVNNLMDFCGIPLTEAILCATETPAKQMGVYESCGSIEPGKRADLLFLRTDARLEIDRVMLRGELLP